MGKRGLRVETIVMRVGGEVANGGGRRGRSELKVLGGSSGSNVGSVGDRLKLSSKLADMARNVAKQSGILL